jgi:flagellar hook protein FlgE
MFYQQIGEAGSGNTIQVGGGTKVSGTSRTFTEGTILPDANANPADMALSGNGFFVVEQGGVQSLIRAGDFQLNSNGNLVTQNGQLVMGYPVVNGVVDQTAPLTPVTIPSITTEGAHETSVFSVSANLDSNATIGAKFSTPLQIYDTLGYVTIPHPNHQNRLFQYRSSFAKTPKKMHSTCNQYGYTIRCGTVTGI